MIKRWNEKVAQDDDVYHLGDFAYETPAKIARIADSLNGRIHIIKGNHDKSLLQCKNSFEWIKDYHELKIADPEVGSRLIVLCHYAMRVWNKSHHGSWHLYGHTHGHLPDEITSLSFDVGVDCHDYYPLSYEDVKRRMKSKKWTSPHANSKR